MKVKIGTGLSWLLMLLCAGFIVYLFSVQSEQLRILGRVSPGHIGALMILYLGYLGLHGYRSLVVLSYCSSRPIAFRPWIRIYVLGRFLDVIVPQLGNLYRAVRLKNKFAVSYTHSASGLLTIAWLTNLLNLILAVTVVLTLSPQLRVAGLPATWLLAGLAVATALAPVLLARGLNAIAIPVRWLAWAQGKASEAVAGALDAARDWRHLGWVTVLGVAQFLLAVTIFYVCFQGLGIPATPGGLVLFYVLLQLSVYVNLTPGNLGVQEVAFGALAEAMGTGMAEGILVSALLRVVSYLVLAGLALPLGGLDVLRQRETYRS